MQKELKILNKLYLNDSYLVKFSAVVEDVIKEDGKILVILDKTAFYPEGGGQPCDTGHIGESAVSYVYEENDKIYHVVDKDIEPSGSVECFIDWERRFDHMQQHCGQHILSAAFAKLLSGETVGFHLGNDYVTVDIAVESLTPEDTARVEKMSNDIVFDNIPIRLHYPGPDEISKFELRKEPSVEENIRIVEIDNFDFSPCGGTHPKHTGDVGLIKIRKWEKIKNAIRVEFLCGRRALKDYTWKNDYINELSSITSSKDTDILENIKKSISELHNANKENRLLKDKVLTYEAQEFYNNAEELKGVKVIKQQFENREFKEIISLAGKVVKNKSAVVLFGLKSDSAQMVFTRSTDVSIKINELFKEVLPLINGKGGGNPQSAQGGGPDISNLQSALDGAFIILKNRYL